MAFSEILSNRIRDALAELPSIEEKKMFGGNCFMVNDKMCVGVMGDEMMCRIGEEHYEEAIERRGCREMVFTGKRLKGFVYVSEEGLKTKNDFDYWIGLCLNFNKIAKASKKKVKRK